MTSVHTVFSIVNQAKNFGSYEVANIAFTALIDMALNKEKELHFIWEWAGERDSYYYDLLVVSDGVQSACISARLLEEPYSFKHICKKQIGQKEHLCKTDIPSLIDKDIQAELKILCDKLLEISPNIQSLANKLLVSKECHSCVYFDGQWIYCAVNPCGYPDEFCKDWKIN